MIKKYTLAIALLSLGFNSYAQLPTYVPTNGLLAWYGFNNNSSDLSGNNNNASNNNVTFINDRNGVPNSAGSFNGINTYFQVTTPSFTFASTDSFTYSVWINKDVQPAAGIILMIGSNAAGNFISILQGSSVMSYGTNKQQSAWINITCPHTLNVWDHYVATYDAGTMNLYKNGVWQSTGTFTHMNVTSANLPFYIGKGFGGGNFKGAIDDVGVWGRALSQTEITALYNTVTSTYALEANNAYVVNPSVAEDFIYLSSNAPLTSQTNYTIYDVKGALVQTGNTSENNHQIQINHLNKGIYFIHLNDEINSRLKFVKF
jgi:hypothetical protein